MRKPAVCHMQTTKAQISLGGCLRIRSLIRAFVVCCLDSIIPILAKSKISRLLLAFVAEQAGLSLTVRLLPSCNPPKTGFLMTWFNCISQLPFFLASYEALTRLVDQCKTTLPRDKVFNEHQNR